MPRMMAKLRYKIRFVSFVKWAGQFAGIENQTMHRFEQYLKILQLHVERVERLNRYIELN